MPPYAPSAYEQYSLELINRARLDPAGEFDAMVVNAATRTGVTGDITQQLRLLGVDMDMLRSQLAAIDPVAPVAWNGALAAAAEKHSVLLARNGSQSHQEPGEASLGDRIRAEGYVPWRWAENVFSWGKDPVFTHAGFVIDWGYGAGGMQTPANHRSTILDGRLKEVGIGAVESSGRTGPWVVTQDFAHSGPTYAAQLVGVVIDDRDGDDFYDIGEGLGGVSVTVTGAGGTWQTTTWASGGYQLALAAGTYTVTFAGAGLDGTVTRTVVFGGTQNVKLDAEADDAAAAPVERPLPVVPAPVFPDGYLAGSAAAETLIGSARADAIFAGAGADMVHGGAGADLISGEGYDPVFDPAAAQVYRLFVATLGRAPGTEGHLAWTGRLTDGTTSLAEMARAFVESAEFEIRFAADRASDFVDHLYGNVLGRAGAAEGRAYWSGQIDSGAMSRAEVVVSFAESAEHVARTLPESLGFSRAGHQAAWADDVYRLFGATLGRAPAAAGVEAWAEALAEGRSYLGVIGDFVGSAEFATRFGSVRDAAGQADGFVDLLYGNVLGRSGNSEGRAYWSGQIEDGTMSAAQVVAYFAQSAENVARTASGFTAWAADAGGDRLAGGAGNDIHFGGIGGDTFVFDRMNRGVQTVADLEAHDRIELRGFGYDSEAAALSHVTALADGTAAFVDQGTSIVFTGLTPADIEAAQFLIA